MDICESLEAALESTLELSDGFGLCEVHGRLHGRQYVLCSVLCLTRKEGRVRWIHQLPQFENEERKTRPIDWAGPVLVSDKLLVVSSDGHAEAVSPYTGQLLGRVEIPGGAYIAPVVADGTVYIYTNDAELVALW